MVQLCVLSGSYKVQELEVAYHLHELWSGYKAKIDAW